MSDEKTETGAESTEKEEKKEENGVITEEDLLKSLKGLEGKVEEEEGEKEKKVETTNLDKSAADKVKEEASEELKKALEVSDVLSEVVGIIGVHVDSSLEAMQKSVQAAADRDLAMIRVLERLSKAVEANTEAVKKYGDEPTTGKSKTAEGDGANTEILEKGADGGQGEKTPEEKAAAMRGQIQAGLESLVKSADRGTQEQQQLINAAVKFESTGQIDDIMLQKAIGAYKKLSSAA